MSPKQRRSALKAGRLYLEMRGYKLVEQGWSSANHRIDLIASKNQAIEFVGINYVPDGGLSDVADSARAIDKLKQASEAWVQNNKFSGKAQVYILEIYGENYSILSFNEF